jgi:hypothetical protein
MDPFKKLPGYRKAPAGLERKLLRLIPRVFLVGTICILLPSGMARIWTINDAPWMISKFITTIDIYAFSLLSVLWTALFTIGVGALTVMIMKGPAYVADAYPLPDADQPRAATADQTQAIRYAQGTDRKPVEPNDHNT